MSGIKCKHNKRKDRCRDCKKEIFFINDSNLTNNSIIQDYDKIKYEDLLFLCRERKIKGYDGKKKSDLIELLKKNVRRKTLFDYISEENPTLFTKFVGNQNDLKTIPYGTNRKFIWKCDNIECSNTYDQTPYGIYRKDFPRKYCDNCSQENRYINKIYRSFIKIFCRCRKWSWFNSTWLNCWFNSWSTWLKRWCNCQFYCW